MICFQSRSPLAAAPGPGFYTLGQPAWLLGSQVCSVNRVLQRKGDGMGTPGDRVSIGTCVLTGNTVTCAEVLIVSWRPGGANVPMRDQDRCQRKHSRAGDSAGALSWLGTLLWPLPSQDRDPIIPSTRKACFSSREGTRLPAWN